MRSIDSRRAIFHEQSHSFIQNARKEKWRAGQLSSLIRHFDKRERRNDKNRKRDEDSNRGAVGAGKEDRTNRRVDNDHVRYLHIQLNRQ